MTSCSDEEWQQRALDIQQMFCEKLGDREYDIFNKNNQFLIKKKIGYSFFGTPSAMPKKENEFTGYTTDELKHVNKLYNKIVETSDNSRSEVIKIGFLFVVLRLEEDDKYNVLPIYKVATNNEKVFVDSQTRVYTDWDHYLSTNELPRCSFCYPNDGLYTYLENIVMVSFMNSPACNFSHSLRNSLDTIGTVVSVAALGTTVVASAPLLVTGATIATIGAGLYGAARSAETLFDRHQHWQSMSVYDKEARSQYINLTGSTLGCAAGGAAQILLRGGTAVGKGGVLVARGLNWSSLVVNACSVVDNSCTMYDKYLDGRPITKQDYFNLSCEVLFFVSACYSVRNIDNLLSERNSSNNTAQKATNVRKEKLTKTQKRNMQKRNAKAKKRVEHAQQSSEFKSPEFTLNAEMLKIMYRFVCPNAEIILVQGHSILHDYYQMREGKMDLTTFYCNTLITFKELYDKFQSDIRDGIDMLPDLIEQKSFTESFKKGFIEDISSDKFFNYTLWENIFAVQRAIDVCYDDTDDACSLEWILPSICDLTLELISTHFSSSNKNNFCICLHAVCEAIVKQIEIRMNKYKLEMRKEKLKLKDEFQQIIFDQAYGVIEDVGKFMFKAAVRSVDVQLNILLGPESEASQYTGVFLWDSKKDENMSLSVQKSDRIPDVNTYIEWVSQIIGFHVTKYDCTIEGMNGVHIIKPNENINSKTEAIIFWPFEENPLITLVTVIYK